MTPIIYCNNTHYCGIHYCDNCLWYYNEYNPKVWYYIDNRDQAAKLLECEAKTNETAVDAFQSVARYADSQYQLIVNHMNSATYDAKQALVRQANDELVHLKQIGETSRLLIFWINFLEGLDIVSVAC